MAIIGKSQPQNSHWHPAFVSFQILSKVRDRASWSTSSPRMQPYPSNQAGRGRNLLVQGLGDLHAIRAAVPTLVSQWVGTPGSSISTLSRPAAINFDCARTATRSCRGWQHVVTATGTPSIS